MVNRSRDLFLVVTACLVLCQASSASAQSGCGWSPGYALEMLDGTVSALGVHDDGRGPALYAAGDFEYAGNLRVRGIARWDGRRWEALAGPSGLGISGTASILLSHDDGSGPALFVGGLLQEAGGVPVSSLARWDGSSWGPVGTAGAEGVAGSVATLAAFDDGSGPGLFVGGSFSSAGGVQARSIARWRNGTGWDAVLSTSSFLTEETLGTPSVMALSVFDDGDGPALFLAGFFSHAGILELGNIARWNGQALSALTTKTTVGLPSPVNFLTPFGVGQNRGLIVTGSFTAIGGVVVQHIAQWRAGAWLPLAGPSGPGLGEAPGDLLVHDDGNGPQLYVSGELFAAGGQPARRIARWDGDAWSPLAGGARPGFDGTALGMVSLDLGEGPELWIGGVLVEVGGVYLGNLARWNGTTWRPNFDGPSHGVGGVIWDLLPLETPEGPRLLALGGFFRAGQQLSKRLAVWDGRAWEPFAGLPDPGIEDPPNRLFRFSARAAAFYDDGTGNALYVGGEFWRASGRTVFNIAKWSGSEWLPLADEIETGARGAVRQLLVFDPGTGPELVVLGSFAYGPKDTSTTLLRWDGSTWRPGLPADGPGQPTRISAWRALVHDDGAGPALYVLGGFQGIGAGEVTGLARWRSGSWQLLGALDAETGSPFAHDLLLFDSGNGPQVHVAGSFDSVNGVAASNLARWTGGTWSAIPGSSAFDGGIYRLAAADDGRGPALFASGWFTQIGALPASSIARWQGGAWSPLAGPFADGGDPLVYDMVSFDDGAGPALFVGGGFREKGGLESYCFARWSCSSVFVDGFETGDTSGWSTALPTPILPPMP